MPDATAQTTSPTLEGLQGHPSHVDNVQRPVRKIEGHCSSKTKRGSSLTPDTSGSPTKHVLPRSNSDSGPPFVLQPVSISKKRSSQEVLKPQKRNKNGSQNLSTATEERQAREQVVKTSVCSPYQMIVAQTAPQHLPTIVQSPPALKCFPGHHRPPMLSYNTPGYIYHKNRDLDKPVGNLPTYISSYVQPTLPGPSSCPYPTSVAKKPNSTGNYLLRVIESVIVLPELTGARRSVTGDFQFSRPLLDSFVKRPPGADGSTAAETLHLGSRLSRIRCIEMNPITGPASPSEWVAMKNEWPDHFIVILNGSTLRTLRDLDGEKALPVDSTSYIKEGNNTVVATIQGPLRRDTARYRVGIETIVLIDKRLAEQSITYLPCHEGRKRILDRTIYSDPDVSIDDSRTVLDLTDPFTALACRVPVRGRFCRHDQCFDRDTFLQTRDGTDPDSFRCPICSLDARPRFLVIDGFYAQVSVDLEKMGRLDAKAIIMYKNGSWAIKEQTQWMKGRLYEPKHRKRFRLLAESQPTARD